MRPGLLPIIFANVRRDPVLLFTKYNATGFLYDRFDPAYGRLFQDQSNTPSDADGEAIGLALERSQSVAIGGTIITNGAFDTDLTGWAVTNVSGGTTAWDSGRMKLTTTGTAHQRGSQDKTVESGAFYEVMVDIDLNGAADCQIKGGSTSLGSDLLFSTETASGSKRFIVLTTTTLLSFTVQNSQATATIYADNVSVRKIAGNHGKQTTAGSKATLRQVNGRWLIRGDGLDDNLLTTLNPATSMTLIEVGTPDSGSASDVLMGSQPASDGRAYLALSSSGYLAGGVGTQNTSTIVDANSQDIRSVRCGKAIVWDGTSVRLYLMLPGGSLSKVYDAAQSGAANTTIPLRILALNANGTASAPADSDSEMFFAVQAAMSEADIRSAMRWKL